jgi:hypothetical protein
MERVHLFEFEDFDWVPHAIRDGGTDLLDLAFDRMGFYAGVAPKLAAVLEATRAERVFDLCSGGGGGTLSAWRLLPSSLRERVSLTLTDRHPNAAGIARVEALADPRVRYASHPVDAMQGGGDEPGVRTMSGALHHFTPDAVKAILAGVVARRAPLVFFDVAASPALRKTPLALAPIAMTLNMTMLFAASLLLVPFARPFRLSRVLFTYALPAIPALVAWDGTVSALRAYAPDEVLALARAVPGAERYTWEAGVEGRALYLTGVPRD